MSDERQRLERFLLEEVEHYFQFTRHEQHEDDALKSVCQVIVWACALDEYLEKTEPGHAARRESEEGGKHMMGLRFARNRAVHQFVQMLAIYAGAALPAPFPVPLYEVTWRPAYELPPPDKGFEKRGLKLEACYRQHLQNVPVRFTFDWVLDFLRCPPPKWDSEGSGG